MSKETKSERIALQRAKILELEYRNEALENEVENLHEIITNKHERLGEIIKENDRLTLSYEPFIPEGHEDHGLTFYGLKEENDEFMHNILEKMEIIKEQDKVIEYQNKCLARQRETIKYQNTQLENKMRKSQKVGTVSFDFWPLKDWFRLSYTKWNPGKYAQLCIGPVRIDWFAD